jgi:DNA-3-methyladenine glycosylase
MRVLQRSYFSRETDVVARDLLGKLLLRRLFANLLGGIIVETEAYFGKDDPASRAFQGLKNYNKVMFEHPGRLFIYNVHRYWMLNIIAHREGVGGILIRAIEPTIGIDIMKQHRSVKSIKELTNGPGKLTLALNVDKSLNGSDVTSLDSPIYVLDNDNEYDICTSNRIGVTKDLNQHLRFFIKNNKFVSK